jgi:ribulose-bisphosphate carboxylase large chain
MREAWASAARGESVDDAFEKSPALRRAAELFGPVRV